MGTARRKRIKRQHKYETKTNAHTQQAGEKKHTSRFACNVEQWPCQQILMVARIHTALFVRGIIQLVYDFRNSSHLKNARLSRVHIFGVLDLHIPRNHSRRVRHP